jgi:predicted dehydrogenase
VTDIGSHWCDLAQHITGDRIVSVLADLATAVPVRYKPRDAREAFATGDDSRGEPFTMKSEDLATILLRFESGGRGVVSVGQVCAGHKNDLWLEISGSTSSLRWRQEQQNELWIGQRDAPNAVMAKDPSLLARDVVGYAHLPGGHQEGWPDAFFNLLRDVYNVITGGASHAAPAAYATFEDGYRVACLIDAVLESQRHGGVWTGVLQAELAESSR